MVRALSCSLILQSTDVSHHQEPFKVLWQSVRARCISNIIFVVIFSEVCFWRRGPAGWWTWLCNGVWRLAVTLVTRGEASGCEDSLTVRRGQSVL